MEVTLTTPSILFPAVSLLMLAYTNRYLAIASITRTLHARFRSEGTVVLRRQIENLRTRLALIRRMQVFGILSLIGCIVSVVTLYFQFQLVGECLFGFSLLLMLVSLIYSVREVALSGRALEIELEDMEESCREG